MQEIFGRVGPVRSVRILTDKDTGRYKGYGFVEYDDFDTAESAVRNLNGEKLSGRPLRVHYSVDDATAEKTPPGGSGGGHV